jgi:hypothetical protein
MRAGFVNTVSALCYSILRDERAILPLADRSAVSPNAVVNFVLEQYRRMPDYLRLPLMILTIVFDLAGLRYGGSRFHRTNPAARQRQIDAWRNSSFGFARDFVRLYDSLAIFCWTSMLVADRQMPVQRPVPVLEPEIALSDVVVTAEAVPLGRAATVMAQPYQPA